MRWENTLIPWLEEQGFTRGQNEKSVLYHEERDIVLLVYVDDVLADASRDNVDWIFDLMDKRFKCKDSDFLSEDTPLDYVGIEVEKTKTHIVMHMKKYILGAIKILQSKSPSSWREASKYKPSMPSFNCKQAGVEGILIPGASSHGRWWCVQIDPWHAYAFDA